jgi:hypothetical protein
MGWTETNLLHFCEVVSWISVQNQLANRYQWILSMGPHLGIGTTFTVTERERKNQIKETKKT